MVESKSFTFAVQITHLSRKLANDQKEFILANQLLRAGTAIGALVSEAKFAQSKADFINKMNVALKEANESSYWFITLPIS